MDPECPECTAAPVLCARGHKRYHVSPELGAALGETVEALISYTAGARMGVRPAAMTADDRARLEKTWTRFLRRRANILGPIDDIVAMVVVTGDVCRRRLAAGTEKEE